MIRSSLRLRRKLDRFCRQSLQLIMFFFKYNFEFMFFLHGPTNIIVQFFYNKSLQKLLLILSEKLSIIVDIKLKN